MISFDIFDTLITRITLTPEGIFALTAEQVFSRHRDEKCGYEGCVQDFVHLRVAAEKNVRKRYQKLGKKEITYDSIYDVIEEAGVVSKTLLLELKDQEIKTEIEAAIKIQQNIELLKTYMSAGEKVVLISDMYLPKTVIKDILKKTVHEIADLPLYVSSDVDYVKSDGSLFSYVGKCENEEYSSWTHFGDNQKSDYIIPKMLGINVGTIHSFDNLKPILYYIQNSQSYQMNTQMELGIMNYLMERNNHVAQSQKIKDQNGFLTGVTVGGPLILPYVRWIIDDCKTRHIDNIYFLSRDGYILKKVADIILEREDTNIQTHYLYSSRKAWQKSDDALLIRYAEQNIDLDKRAALVDVQGTGYTVNCFINTLRKKHPFNPFVYYYSLDYIGIKLDYDIKSYSFENEDYVLEVLCRAPEDKTIGFKYENGVVIPLFEMSGVDWNSTGIISYLDGVCRYVEMMTKYCGLFKIEVKGHQLERLIKHFLLSIGDKKIDEFLGDMPFDYSTEYGEQFYAVPLSKKHAMDIYLKGNQGVIGGVRRKIALRRTSKEVRNEINNLNTPSYVLSAQEEEVLNSFISNNLDQNKQSISSCVIYGAGEYGRTVYRIFEKSKRYVVIAWTDMNYESFRNKGINVIPPYEIRELVYDMIIIAIKDRNTAENVKATLRLMTDDRIQIEIAEDLFSDKNISI